MMKNENSEREAVRTTIVGGRPPGCGKDVGPIPRGIEVLVKKASVDAEFKALLLEKRAGAAAEVDLTLDAAEAAMLNAVPAAQLEAIIARTKVAPRARAAFLGRTAATMIVALGVGVAGCDRIEPTKGIAPEPPEQTKKENEEPHFIAGIMPASELERPQRQEPTDGIRPDAIEDL